MKALTSAQLRKQYLDFFVQRGHAVIGSASLIPENDPTVLFTTAGMHPLVPYLMGQKHPAGTRLTDVQKCVRTGDIDEVGDATHCTFFEMLGNWSLGDYFKKESITWSYEFLTKVLGINPDNLAVSVFAGDSDCPRDEEAAAIWEQNGIKKDRIFFLPKENNWWGPAGITGPCGSDTEIFIDTGKPACGPNCSPACDCGKYIEIWNNVFMQYNKTKEGTFEPLEQKNVDTGMGLERTICILQGKKSVYETDVFQGAIEKICSIGNCVYGQDPEITKAIRIIADHVRTATFIMGDDKGVSPGNVDQGYIVRRLIRRAVRFGKQLNFPEGALSKIAELYIEQYKDIYPELNQNRRRVLSEFDLEEDKFGKTIATGLKEFEKVVTHIPTKTLPGKTVFRLYDTFGFPPEMTAELAKEQGFEVDMEGFENAFKEHQEKSSKGAEQKFKGGLQDNSVETTKLHTATHLLLGALRKVLNDDNIIQRGSNITAERLRFDFNFPRPLTEEEIKAIEVEVNKAIAEKVPVVCEEMSIEEATAQGASGVFSNKYGEIVKVYTIGNYSKELCGGPHVANTEELGTFEIQKEQSSSAGVRRIRAILK